MLSNGDLLSHLMSLHYTWGNMNHARKLCLFSHAVYRVSKTALLWLAVSSTLINQF